MTGSNLTDALRKDVIDHDGFNFIPGCQAGSIDAPDLIPAGATRWFAGRYASYPMGEIVSREWAQ